LEAAENNLQLTGVQGAADHERNCACCWECVLASDLC